MKSLALLCALTPVLGACGFTPGRLTVQSDAAEPDDAQVVGTNAGDAALDAPDGPRPFDPATDCPTEYSLSVGTSTSRYRVVTSESAFAARYADCNDDRVDATHLASPETAVELADLRAYLAAGTFAPSRKYYMGIVQIANQTEVDAGWIVYTGGPLPPNGWATAEPEDAGGSENNAQNVSSLWVDTGLTDSTGNISYGAVCECDGLPIHPDALAAIP